MKSPETTFLFRCYVVFPARTVALLQEPDDIKTNHSPHVTVRDVFLSPLHAGPCLVPKPRDVSYIMIQTDGILIKSV